ncbi:MAG: hypothetical protein ACQEQV_07195 [Fibrobacterota bacterium]
MRLLITVFALLLCMSGCSDSDSNSEETDVSDSSVDTSASSRDSFDLHEAPDTYVYSWDTLMDTLSDKDAWSLYKDVRSQAMAAEDSNSYYRAYRKRLCAGEAMLAVSRPGIASWQFNNAAKNLISWFSRETGYSGAASADSARLQEEFHLLERAQLSLDLARSLNLDAPSKKREQAIENNLDFIADVRRACDGGDAQ